MKKLLILLLLPFLCGANLVVKDSTLKDLSLRTTYTDYCQDANTVLCLRMNDDQHDTMLDETGGEDINFKVTNGTGVYGTTNCGEGSCWAFSSDNFGNNVDGDLRILGDMSICVWIYINNTPASFEYIYSQGASGETSQTDFMYGLGITDSSGDKYFAFHEYSGGNNQLVLSGLTVDLTTLTHLCAVRDTVAKEYQFYKNGVAEGSAISYTNNPTDGSTTKGNVGSSGINSQWWDGTIDELIITNDKLTATEILDIYNNGLR